MSAHYQYCGAPCIAAIVTQVNDDFTVALQLFYPPNHYQISASLTSRVRQTLSSNNEEVPTWHFAGNCSS